MPATSKPDGFVLPVKRQDRVGIDEAFPLKITHFTQNLKDGVVVTNP
jgi:hypothetical protein